MPTTQLMVQCKGCGKPTLHVGQVPNHVVHFILTILTAGLWLIVWLLVAAGTQNPQCTLCGRRNSKLKSFALS